MSDFVPSIAKPAPDAFRAALAELVQIGVSVARMLGHAAEAETALAEAATRAGAEEDASALAASLAEAIEADRAAAAAAEARQTVALRCETLAAGFARVARSVRLTVMLAERLDRGWARPVADDRHAMARRQIARGVEAAILREADGEHAERLRDALADRLESLDTERGIDERPAEALIREICRGLGLASTEDGLPDGIAAALAPGAAEPGSGSGLDQVFDPGLDPGLEPGFDRGLDPELARGGRAERPWGARRRPDG